MSWISMFVVINFFQLLMAFAMIRIYYPQMLIDTVRALNNSAMNFKFLSRWSWGPVDSLWLYNVRVPQYADFSITDEYSGSFLVNEFQLVKVVILLAFIHLGAIGIYWALKKFRK